MALKPSRRAFPQKDERGRSYSTTRTALPAFVNGRASPHSRYRKALLDDGEVERRLEGLGLVEVVLERDAEPARVGGGRDEAIEPKLILRPQRKAGVVGIPIDVVGLDCVEALAPATVQAGAQDGLQGAQPADVEPALAGPSVQLPSEQAPRKS